MEDMESSKDEFKMDDSDIDVSIRYGEGLAMAAAEAGNGMLGKL